MNKDRMLAELRGEIAQVEAETAALAPAGDPDAVGSTWLDRAGREFTLVVPVDDQEAVVAYADGTEGRMSLRGCRQIASWLGWV